MRILFADGDEVFRDIAQHYLSQNGHKAEACANGLECVASLCLGVPDVVVLEREMLWGGGDGVLARMQQDVEWSRIPVILTSDDELPDEPGSNSGPVLAAQLQKPYRLEDLLGHLQAVLDCDSIYENQISSPNLPR